uniref:Uncharacterized protein n=1 Tax=Anguilla anguilla TaxID=7936 RepID=A0A0E9VT90_ANGAN
MESDVFPVSGFAADGCFSFRKRVWIFLSRASFNPMIL